MSASGRTQSRDTFDQNGRTGIDQVKDIPLEANTLLTGRVTLAAIREAIVETLDGKTVSMVEFLDERTLLLLVDDRFSNRHRTAAEIAWVEERLDPGVRLVLVWRKRPVTLRQLSPARDGTLSVVDCGGELRRLLETAGSRKALLSDTGAGTVETVNENSEVFSLGREIRMTDARGSDHVIDLGDLT